MSATTDDPRFVTADCPSHQSGGATLDVIPPSTRGEAAAWAQSPYEAARNTQTAPAFEGTLGDGELIEVPSSPKKTVYSVMQDGRQIGLLTVRPVGFGAFATEQIEACSPR